MSRSPQEILEEALQLPPDQIDWLVESLLIKESISADNEPQADVEAAWDAEIKRRLDEIDSGAVEMHPGRSGARRDGLCSFSSRQGAAPSLKLLQFHPAARREMIAAHGWYGRQSHVAADGLYNELLPALDRVQRQPRLYPAHRHNTQRLVLRRYPFSIVYRELLNKIQIIAIAHAKRKPGYWAKRL